MLEFLTITLIIILSAISPGPDFAMVVKNALLHHRKAGIFTALGVSFGLFVHSTYCILGLAVIITKSLLLFSIIKYFGAAYLIYIGIKGLLAKRSNTTIEENPHYSPMTAYKAFMKGLLCNLLNPKSIMFILAFFTLIINPASSLAAQFAYAIEIMLVCFIWFSLLTLMITHKRVKQSLNKIQFYIVKFMGVVLIGFGARIAFLHRLAM